MYDLFSSFVNIFVNSLHFEMIFFFWWVFNGGLRLGKITKALHHVQLLLVAEIESLKSNFQYQPFNIKS